MKAVILAAGKGTRFGEITKKIPKSLIPVAGKPIIEYTLEALPSSIKEVYLVVGHLGDMIKNHVGKEYKGIKINYIEIKKLTGTATALWKARKYLGKEKFLVIYGDDLYSKKELEKLVRPSTSLRVRWAFGLIKTIYQKKKEMKTRILISSGAYVMDGKIFKYKPVKLANGEYGLPQTMLKAAKDIPIKGVVMKNWIQINKPEDVKRAERMIK